MLKVVFSDPLSLVPMPPGLSALIALFDAAADLFTVRRGSQIYEHMRWGRVGMMKPEQVDVQTHLKITTVLIVPFAVSHVGAYTRADLLEWIG